MIGSRTAIESREPGVVMSWSLNRRALFIAQALEAHQDDYRTAVH